MMRSIKTLILLACVMGAQPMVASAATISFDASPSPIGTGDLVRVRAIIESAVPANAFSGTLLYSPNLEPIAVSDGSSIIPIWATRPTIANSSPIQFAGITPGGFSGSDGILFTVLFRATSAGRASITLEEAQVLRNDGAGTNEPITLRPLALSIESQAGGGYTESKDTTQPEPFGLTLGSDAQLFEGRSYMAFSTTDKGSGIDHYEIAENRIPPLLSFVSPLSWVIGTSPYVLHDQARTSTVYVRAVDRAGNIRLSVYPPRHIFTAYEIIVFLAILIGVVFLYKRRG